MRITTDYCQFFRTTKVIRDWQRFRELGLFVECPVGNMRPGQVHEALEVCAANSDIHIVTNMGNGIFVNRYERQGKLFKLAEGDNDPHYILDTRAIYMWMFGGDFDKDSLLSSLKVQSNSRE